MMKPRVRWNVYGVDRKNFAVTSYGEVEAVSQPHAVNIGRYRRFGKTAATALPVKIFAFRPGDEDDLAFAEMSLVRWGQYGRRNLAVLLNLMRENREPVQMTMVHDLFGALSP